MTLRSDEPAGRTDEPTVVPAATGGRIARTVERLRRLPRSKLLFQLFSGGLFILAIAAIVYQVVRDLPKLQSYSWTLRPEFVAIGFGVYSISLIFTALIWASIISTLSGRRGWLSHVRLYCLTNVANRLPTALPYIGARAEAYSQIGVKRVTTLTSMAIEVTVTIVGATVVALATLPFGPYESVLAPYLPLLALPPIGLLLVALRPRWLIGAINAGARQLGRPPIATTLGSRPVALWTIGFVLIWLNGGVLNFILASAVYPFELSQLPLLINVFAVSGVAGWLSQLTLILPTPALRQVVTAYLLSFVVPWPVAVAVALLARLAVMTFELAWALGFVVAGRLGGGRAFDGR